MLQLLRQAWSCLTNQNRNELAPRIESLESRQLLSAAPHAATTIPRYDHVVIVVEENHGYSQILGTPVWPPLAFNPIVWAYINQPLPILQDLNIRTLAGSGTSMTQSHGLTHPSQPNYLALFSGSTQGVTSDATPRQPFAGPDLASELAAAGLSFAGYSESMPHAGYSGEDTGAYVRHHNPWVDFSDVPVTDNLTFSQFPHDFSKLPTVSFVTPNIYNDMHSGTVQRADRWLKQHISSYAHWATKHNSLLIVTWDEDNGTASNHIPTIFSGAGVHHGFSNQPINHYNVLRTIEDMYKLPPLGQSASATPIIGIFS